jgi:hypothetical protein
VSVASTSRNSNPGRTGQRYAPFGKAAEYYRELGWMGVIPVSRKGTKAPLFAGVTGHKGRDASPELLTELITRFYGANIGLRLPFSIVGIDIDAYDGHSGAASLAELGKRLGDLPETWRSTSRAPSDPVSGIYLFRAPRRPENAWVTDLGTGSGIEIIQTHHRFATVAPSRHNSTGQPYYWWLGSERVSAPRPGDLPLLPVSWGRYLLSARRYRASATATDAQTASWYARVASGPMCSGMEAAARTEAARISDAAASGELHETARRAVTHLCRNAAEGCVGLDNALRLCEAQFLRARRKRNLLVEWQSFVKSAMAKAAALRQEKTDMCGTIRNARPRVAQ